MKKSKMGRIILISICFFSLVMNIKYSQVADAKIIHVDTNSNHFNKIQHAIDNSSDGDSIFVHNGTYNEYIKIDKSIKLIGEDRNNTIIDSKLKNITIYISAEDVTIESFTVQNNGGAIENFGVTVTSNNCVIKYNIIKNCRTGIILQDCNNNSIHNNIISNNTYGIGLSNSSKNVVHENYVSNNKKTGVYFSDGISNKIWENTIIKNNYGIATSFENNIMITGNLVYNNLEQGLNIYNSNHIVISSNSIKNHSYGILLYSNDKNITISNNQITKSQIGIYIPSELDDYKVTNNMFSFVNEKIRYGENKKTDKILPILIITILILLIFVDIIIVYYLMKKKK